MQKRTIKIKNGYHNGDTTIIESQNYQVFIMIKPDGEKHAEEIIARLEKAGLRLIKFWQGKASHEKVKLHYDRKARARYGRISTEMMQDYMTNGIVTAMIWEGPNAYVIAKQVKGSHKEPDKNPQGSVRHDFQHDTLEAAINENRALENTMHASENAEEAMREAQIWLEEIE